MTSVHLAAMTHVGRVRIINEDACALPGVVVTGSPPAPVTMKVETPDVFVVAVVDGMGGHAAGDEASRLVAGRISALDSSSDVEAAILSANDLLYDRMERNPPLAGMGATIVALRVGADSVEMSNVGDSRGYVHRGGFLQLLSTDDGSDAGPEVVTQSLGGHRQRSPISVHRRSTPVTEPARFLLCSDGLTDELGFSDIEVIVSDGPVESVASRLIEATLDAGASDNVSVIVVDVVFGAVDND